MKSLEMNNKLLNLICTVKAAKDLFLSEAIMYGNDGPKKKSEACSLCSAKSEIIDDHLARTRNYFFAMSDDLVQSLGLAKNEYCFEAICRFEISPEIVRAESEDLGKYTFSY